ncbi:hypothetical protein H5410_004522 [Solanum commersonii]|uniref:Uncharacterized protein n=1 Tax=Solanum commersonii TaxID=4109 RepID=A0A9J6B7L0_SOLCO|nr:hypothetical protein H5410_004522 [Solanum commersonii]
MQEKLSGWKTKFLNIEGRKTLSKVCLNNLPTHTVQFTKPPRRIINKIDQIQRNFIWGSTSDHHTWGTGAQRTDIKNLALLPKLAWRAFKQPSSLWASTLLNKYTKNGKLESNHGDVKPHSSRQWKHLMIGWNVCQKGID